MIPTEVPPAAEPTDTASTPTTDTWVVRFVVILLGLVALAVVIGGAVLAAQDHALPGELIAIGAGASGALAAMLSSTRSARN